MSKSEKKKWPRQKDLKRYRRTLGMLKDRINEIREDIQGDWDDVYDKFDTALGDLDDFAESAKRQAAEISSEESSAVDALKFVEACQLYLRVENALRKEFEICSLLCKAWEQVSEEACVMDEATNSDGKIEIG